MEAVKLPCLAAESSWLGFPLVKLHPKPLRQLRKSSAISGSVCSKDNCSSPLALLTKRDTCSLEGKPACLSHQEQAVPGFQPAWGTACPAPSPEHSPEQAGGVWNLGHSGHSNREMPTLTVVSSGLNLALWAKEAAARAKQPGAFINRKSQSLELYLKLYFPNIPEQGELFPANITTPAWKTTALQSAKMLSSAGDSKPWKTWRAAGENLTNYWLFGYEPIQGKRDSFWRNPPMKDRWITYITIFPTDLPTQWAGEKKPLKMTALKRHLTPPTGAQALLWKDVATPEAWTALSDQWRLFRDREEV